MYCIRRRRALEDSIKKYLGVLGYGFRALSLVWATSKALTVWFALFTIISGTLPAAAAYVGKLVVDGVIRALQTDGIAGRDEVIFWVVVEGLLVLSIAGAQRGITTVQGLLKAVLGHRITTMILEKSLTLRLSQFEDPEIHDQMMQARREALTRPIALVTGTFALVRDCITLVSYGVLLFQFSGWAVVAIIVAGLPAFIVEARFSGESFRFVKKKTPEMRERNYLETVMTREDFAKELLVFRLGRKLLERYHDLFERLYTEDRRLQLRRGIWGFIFGALSSITLYGAYMWIVLETMGGQLTIGEMTMYLVLFRQGQTAVTRSLTGIGVMYENNLFLSNLYGFLEIPVADTVGEATEPLDESDGLRFEAVTFTYPDSSAPAIRDISFQLRPGQQLALVGENGSGKTTMIKLLTRLYEPERGRIMLHGWDIREWDVSALRARLAVIFQDFVKFKFTVGENIGAGDVARFEERDLWQRASERALARDMIETLPSSYDTRLGRAFKGGHELSGGQWQKVALSRLFMKEQADLFVLDEPTAAVDAEAEARIFEHVREATAGKMSILISHRLSFPRSADLILVMSEGQIIERGDHRQLMELDGRYAEMFRLQASGYRDSLAGGIVVDSDDE